MTVDNIGEEGKQASRFSECPKCRRHGYYRAAEYARCRYCGYTVPDPKAKQELDRKVDKRDHGITPWGLRF